jgi:hypothetical protein
MPDSEDKYGENMIVTVWLSVSSISIVCYPVFGGDILVRPCPLGDIMVVVVCCVVFLLGKS